MEYLSQVGIAVSEMTASETGYSMDFYVAKESLNHFKEGLDTLNLDAQIRTGMEELIKYLQKKIDKRIRMAETPGETPME